MTVPGVGAIVALQVKAGIDDPARFRSSKNVGPHFGLTPRREQSGERDVVGAISAAGRPERPHRPVSGSDGDALPVAGEKLAQGPWGM